MATVDPVEFTPLPACKGSENRMVQQIGVGSKSFLALPDHFIHDGNLRSNLGKNLVTRKAARHRLPGCDASFGHVTQAQHHISSRTLFPCWFSDVRVPAIQAAFEPLGCPGVSEIKVLEDFRAAPLSFPSPREVLRIHITRDLGNDILESLQVEIHRQRFRFV